VTCDGSSDFATAVGQEKSKENGSNAGYEGEQQYKACCIPQGLTPRPSKLEQGQEHNQSDGKMYQRWVEAADELQPVSVGFTVQREKERQERNGDASTDGANPYSGNQACCSQRIGSSARDPSRQTHANIPCTTNAGTGLVSF
jgi:hypothetical protein